MNIPNAQEMTADTKQTSDYDFGEPKALQNQEDNSHISEENSAHSRTPQPRLPKERLHRQLSAIQNCITHP
jgi:hypothetical protein